MPKKFLRRYMPDPEQFRHRKGISLLGSRILEPNLWHLNRRSVTTAVAASIFVAFLPIPGHMPVVAMLAMLVRCNLPLSVLMVWINNPLTITAIYYYSYRVGVFILQLHPKHFVFEPNWHWLVENSSQMWRPLLTGCLVNGIVFALVASVLVNLLWRLHVTLAWRARKRRRMHRHDTIE